MTITFTVPAVPKAQPRQRHRVMTFGDRHVAVNYTPKDDPVNAFKATVRILLRQAYVGSPIRGPVGLAVSFIMPRPKSKFWKTKSMPREWHSIKPDSDNLVKSLKDALTGLAWLDDAQVCLEHIGKAVGSGDDSPRVEVRITELSSEVDLPV